MFETEQLIKYGGKLIQGLIKNFGLHNTIALVLWIIIIIGLPVMLLALIAFIKRPPLLTEEEYQHLLKEAIEREEKEYLENHPGLK